MPNGVKQQLVSIQGIVEHRGMNRPWGQTLMHFDLEWGLRGPQITCEWRFKLNLRLKPVCETYWWHPPVYQRVWRAEQLHPGRFGMPLSYGWWGSQRLWETWDDSWNLQSEKKQKTTKSMKIHQSPCVRNPTGFDLSAWYSSSLEKCTSVNVSQSPCPT